MITHCGCLVAAVTMWSLCQPHPHAEHTQWGNIKVATRGAVWVCGCGYVLGDGGNIVTRGAVWVDMLGGELLPQEVEGERQCSSK